MPVFLKQFTGSVRQIRKVWFCDPDTPVDEWDMNVIGIDANNWVVALTHHDAEIYFVFRVLDGAMFQESTQLVTNGRLWGVLDPYARPQALLDLNSARSRQFQIRDYSPKDLQLLLPYMRRYMRYLTTDR